MISLAGLIAKLPLAVAYFAAASVAVSLTRFDGGVAFMWFAGPLLIADLMSRPRRQWAASIVACSVASFLATGLFGLGWGAAIPFALINMVEASVAAYLFRLRGYTQRPLESLSWLTHFVFAVGLVAPAASAVLAAGVLATMGKSAGSTLIHFFTGHALGNITFTPLALLVVQGVIGQRMQAAGRNVTAQNAFLLLLVLLVSVAVFTQPGLPLLFLPILPIILVAFRAGRGGAAIAIVMLALCGGAATIGGFGPIQLVAPSLGAKVQFFQFYLAATVLTVLPVVADLHHRKRLHRALRFSEERYRILAEYSTDILLHLEVDGQIRYVSPAIRQLAGHDPDALVGQNSRVLVAPEHLEHVRAAHYATIAEPGQTRTFEYLAVTASGDRRWFETRSRVVLDDDGEIDGVLNVARDISDRKATELRLTTDALTDSLTGLPNRRAYRSQVQQLRVSTMEGLDCIAVLDIDHFKAVNDRFGHDGGDDVLRAFAGVARRMIRDRDMVARIGGEEFAIFFPDTSVDQALAVCDRLRREIGSTYLRAGRSLVRITVSGGVAPLGPEGIDEALRLADRALYEAKRNGRDQFALAA